nr:ATP-binding protein [Micromonospora sp. DSM 115978]
AALVVERGNLGDSTLGTVVLLLLTGSVAGYLVRTAVAAETALARVLEERAADAERERIGRDVHDGALLVLAYLAREAGRGLPPHRVAELAAEQESALRRLLTHGESAAGAAAAAGVGGTADLAAALAVLGRPGSADEPAVTVSTPGMPVDLAGRQVDEVVAAVRAALDNVARHAGPGASAWVLVEDDETAVVVTVRDDGCGMPAGRAEQAARAGRLGLATSVRGRVRDLGGTVNVTSRPGQGTEV